VDELGEEDSARVAQDHPRRDEVIGEVREGDTATTVVASGHVVFHACIVTGWEGDVKRFLSFLTLPNQ